MFEDICWRDAAIPEGVDCFIDRDLFSYGAFIDPSQVYYYCSPSIGMTRDDLARLNEGIHAKYNGGQLP